MNRSAASMSHGRSPTIVTCARSTPSSNRRSASHGPLRSRTRPVSTSVPVTTIPARALALMPHVGCTSALAVEQRGVPRARDRVADRARWWPARLRGLPSTIHRHRVVAERQSKRRRVVGRRACSRARSVVARDPLARRRRRSGTRTPAPVGLASAARRRAGGVQRRRALVERVRVRAVRRARAPRVARRLLVLEGEPPPDEQRARPAARSAGRRADRDHVAARGARRAGALAPRRAPPARWRARRLPSPRRLDRLDPSLGCS